MILRVLNPYNHGFRSLFCNFYSRGTHTTFLVLLTPQMVCTLAEKEEEPATFRISNSLGN